MPGVGEGLAPWDEQTYFDLPVWTSLTYSGGAALQIVGADPRRVLLVLSVPQNGSPIQVSTDPALSPTAGISITANTDPLQIFQSLWGPAVAMAWYFIGNLGSKCSALELKLRDWPSARSTKR